MTEDTRTRRRGRYRLLLLLLLFAAPVIGAYALYFWAPEGWRPTGRTHHGRLISPARPVEALVLHDVDGARLDANLFRGKWTLLMIGPECATACVKQLYDTRQVRTALGKNTPRVQRVYVATRRSGLGTLQALAASQHPDLKLAVAEDAEAYAIDRQFAVDGRSPQKNANDLYLLDPHGNWLMYYTADDPPKGLLTDLKKLLRLSNIG
jgi:cytochrome oxidase Cu insertion factor (SCO1/SenC/PrrC family)